MLIIRLLLLFTFGFLVRRLYLVYKAGKLARGRHSAGNHRPPGGKNGPEKSPGMDDLTEQDISDADFEEIP